MAGQKLINNTTAVKAAAEQISNNTVQLESARQSIEHALNETRQSWEQSQADAQTFTKALDENVQYLGEIIGCNKDFAIAIENYMTATEQTSSQTL